MKIFVLLSLLICCITGALSDPPQSITESTSSELPTTTTLSTTSSSEAPPPTTTKEPPTTTKEPPTTTKEPPTTTPSPPVPTTEPSTSTKEPVTTVAPVTTTQFPEPKDCTWNVTDHDITCIRVELKASFIIPIEGKNYQINLGCDAKYDRSDCSSNDTQVLMLYEPKYYNLTMLFERTDKKFTVKEITFGYTLPAGEDIVHNNETKVFSINTGKSYLCKTASHVKLGNVTMNIEQIHIQAFLEKDNTDFGKVEECEADDKVSDVVPIAVGVALAALIIIVLIAYLVGRRRSRQKGYQSV